MKWARTVTRLGAASIIGVATMASPQQAVADTAPKLAKPTISGTPAVGMQLTASAQLTAGDPAPTLTYAWMRCAPDKTACKAIAGATDSTYVVDAADLGRRLAVRVRAENSAGADTARSEPTEVVTSPQPPTPTPTPTPAPTPTPTPTPTPQPSPGPDDGDPPAPRFDQSSASPVVPAAEAPSILASPLEQTDERLPFLRPFPVVRITGTLVPGGARVSRLRIRAPATARVVVRCAGSGCRLFSRSIGGGRVRALERFLPRGTRITIRITRRGTIGKHVKIVIRDGTPPRRRDACLMPGSIQPVPCPSP